MIRNFFVGCLWCQTIMTTRFLLFKQLQFFFFFSEFLQYSVQWSHSWATYYYCIYQSISKKLAKMLMKKWLVVRNNLIRKENLSPWPWSCFSVLHQALPRDSDILIRHCKKHLFYIRQTAAFVRSTSFWFNQTENVFGWFTLEFSGSLQGLFSYRCSKVESY